MNPRPHHRSHHPLILACIAFAAGLLLLQAGFNRTVISFEDSTCQAGEQTPGPCIVPFRSGTKESSVTVRTKVIAHEWIARSYRMVFFGCLTEVTVNEHALAMPEPLCSDGQGVDLILRPYLHEGTNDLDVRMEIKPPVAQFGLRASRRDPAVFTLTMLLMLHVLWFAVFLIRRFFRGNAHTQALVFLFLLGIEVRVLYCAATPYFARAYDVTGHTDYIRYVAEHWQIPPAQLAWETFHPPFTYFMGALWMRLGQWMGRADDAILRDLSVGSFLWSIAILGLTFWIGRMLFEKRPKEELLFAGLFATFPGLVAFASRISNDITYHFFAFLFLAFLLRFWKRGDLKSFLGCAVATGLGMLTKSNAVFFIPMAMVCLVLHPTMKLRPRAYAAVGFLAIVLVLCGWLLWLRYVVQGETALIGNIEHIDPASIIPHGVIYYLIFNPLRVLQQAFISNLGAAPGRAYFFEYFFRSAHFGGFNFGSELRPICGLLLLTNMALIPVMFLGVMQDAWTSARCSFTRCLLLVKKRNTLSRNEQRANEQTSNDPTIPLLITSILLLSAQFAFRWLHPHTGSQDFRFSVLLLVPIFYFLLRGMTLLPPKLRAPIFYTVLLSIFLSTAFAGILFWYS